MLRNYVKVVLRNLVRELTYSTVNIAGLALGMASSMLILLWVAHEVSYDSMYPGGDRIVQVWRNNFYPDHIESRRQVSARVADELAKHSDVENVSVVRAGDAGMQLLSVGNNKVYRGGNYATEQYLDIFTFPVVQGTLDNALADPYSIILTESLSNTLFGTQDPINKSVRIDNSYDVKVTAVIKDHPSNSSLTFRYLSPFKLYELRTEDAKQCIEDWECGWYRVFAKLKPGADLEQVNRDIKDLMKPHLADGEEHEELFLYPLDRWHLHSHFENGIEYDADVGSYVFNMTMLAIVILVVACINFVNLATARSARRAREVGIRKVVGSLRRQLITQFLTESLVITTISFVLALIAVQLSLPLYRAWMGLPLAIDYTSGIFWIFSITLVLVTALLAGFYPAFFLSSFKPVAVLKAKTRTWGGALARRTLVTLQFGLSMLLVIGAIVVFQQMKYGRDRILGYDKTGLITLPNNDELERNYHIIKEELIRQGAITAMTKTNSPITDVYEVNYLSLDGLPDVQYTCTNIFTEYDYCKTHDIRLVEGRDFSPLYASDSSAIILNQSAVDLMGLDRPIGRRINIGDLKFTVIGVMEDVVMTSPYELVDPLFMVLNDDWVSLANRANVTMRIADPGQLKVIESILKTYTPNYPFDYSFIDEEHASKFSSISIVAGAVGLFAMLAVAIASLGLFGLTAFIAEQRQKELSIRKVLGASVVSLVRLLSLDFARLVFIALVVFAPFGMWMMEGYLERYTYHVTVSWWVFPISGALVLGITLFIIGRQALRTARVNPVESLRNE